MYVTSLSQISCHYSGNFYEEFKASLYQTLDKYQSLYRNSILVTEARKQEKQWMGEIYKTTEFERVQQDNGMDSPQSIEVLYLCDDYQ